jgi:hypothetical protein
MGIEFASGARSEPRASEVGSAGFAGPDRGPMIASGWKGRLPAACIIGAVRAPILFALLPSVALADFAADQKQFPRVRQAFGNASSGLEAHFRAEGLAYPPRRIYLRAFKAEKSLEVWVDDPAKRWVLAKAYPFCHASGDLGPKRRQGDLQVPEGFYAIDRFNPWSSFHLSLGVSYPNRSDRILGREANGRANLGGDIFIHGSCASIGCIAITDELIEEVYVLAVLARSRGQAQIPVHIFPMKMTEANMTKLEARDAELLPFWRNIREGFDWFEGKKRLPKVRVGEDGRYLFSGT